MTKQEFEAGELMLSQAQDFLNDIGFKREGILIQGMMDNISQLKREGMWEHLEDKQSA